MLVTLLLVLVALNGALAVQFVDARNFKTFVAEENGPTMVLFFAPWCGHCKKFKPDYKIAGDKLQGIVRFGAIDCDDQTNRSVCSAQNIQGFPTVKLFNSETSKSKVVEYSGDRTPNNVVSFAMSHVKDYAYEVKSADDLAKQLTSIDYKGKILVISKGTSRTANSHAVVRNFLKSKEILNNKAANHAIVVLDSANVLKDYTGPYEEEIKKVVETGGLIRIDSDGKASIFDDDMTRFNIVSWARGEE